MIRLSKPDIRDEDIARAVAVLRSGMLVQGENVLAFERKLAAFADLPHAVAVSSGTAALHLALKALDIGPGDTVIAPAFTFPATANVIELCGAQPVFVDVDPATFNLDLNSLEATLERLMANREMARRVKAVLPVHTFGQMLDMEQLNAMCRRWNLPVVEDAACAIGATFRGRPAGAWGTMGCFSFHPRKAVTTGEGGIVTSDDDALANRVRALRNHGLDPTAPIQDFIMPGYNYRMTEFQAALGLTQMTKLSRIIPARRVAALRYDALLASGPLQSPRVLPGANHVYQSYVALLPEAVAPPPGQGSWCRDTGGHGPHAVDDLLSQPLWIQAR